MTTQPVSDLLTGGYSDLRGRARAGDDSALDEVARQFEAYFLGQMLKSMRKASFEDPIFGSNDANFYRDLFDQQMAVHLASGRGIGFATTLKRQLAESLGHTAQVGGAVPANGAEIRASTASKAAVSSPSMQFPPLLGPDRNLGISDVHAESWKPGARSRLIALTREAEAPERVDAAPAASAPQRFASPGDFVRAVWPHAQEAAAALGVKPELLVAQSALETGWGKHIMARPDGSSSHNLFGIKADARWTGPRVLKSTLEFDGGVMRREKAPFRAYDSLKASFQDYVQFIKGNARYGGALRVGADPESYIRGLQSAGYATDPKYAEKVLALTRREPIQLAVRRT